LVSVEDAAGLQRAPGVGGVVVGGVPVRAEVRRVDVPAVAVAPEDRTPEQVVAVQEAAASLVESFVAAAPAGSDPLVTVTNTDTGAVVNGVLVDPRDGVTPVPVPAEDVVLLEAVDTKVLFAAASGDAVPADATGAVLELSEGGVISAVAYGFPAAVPGEVVIFSTPTLLGSFTIGTDGSFAGQMEIPEGLEPGEHTLVLTAGGVTTSLGLKVAGDGSAVLTPVPISETLPATGSSHDPAVWILLVALGGLMVLISRRRYV
jgi:LPXTG-motif cell wall-anchored protein